MPDTHAPSASDATDAPDAAALLELGQSYWASKTLLSAVELGLFSLLAEKPAPEPEIRERLSLHPRATRDFLDALVGLGALEREGDVYRNSPAADLYLDQAKLPYRGGFLKMLNWQFNLWAQLTDLLRTGAPQTKGPTRFDDFYSKPEAVRGFMIAMDGANALVGPALAKEFDWSGRASFIDVGGARGNLAAAIVKEHPHLRGGSFDLPPVEPFFAEHVARLGLADRLDFHAGDFFTGPMPSADVLIFGHVLHDWNDEQRLTLLRKAYDALPAGGAVLIYDALIDDERRDPKNLLLSLNMQLVTAGGSEYTGADCRGWLAQAGFERTETLPLTDADSLIVGHKGGTAA
ncbi:methyltransferase [Streptomyces bluensis]|uniref:methyltransferase n=1 Tax=Streptomyces bluensis TaxID=33897 RepID=UPI001672834D|nr:methyltransferase [Streptomyces bluensis]GGZ68138.1 O-methyltransferase [Streptomyces bluensis]